VRYSKIFVVDAEKARKVRAMLDAPKATFAQIAQSYSEDPTTVRTGGDNGYTYLRSLPASFREPLARLKVGEVSPVVKIPGGYMIFQVVDRKAGPTAAMGFISPSQDPYAYARKVLRAQKVQEAMDAYFKEVDSKYGFQLNDAFFAKLEKQSKPVGLPPGMNAPIPATPPAAAGTPYSPPPSTTAKPTIPSPVPAAKP
jgi:parvulin-like peptidyl-prolyl isomerase